MRKITDILDDLDAGQAIPNHDVRQLCKTIQRLQRSNLALSDCVRALAEQIEMMGEE